MFGLIKKMFFVLLSNIVNGSNHKKMHIIKQSEIYDLAYHINLHPNENSQEFDYYQFAVK